MDIFLFCVSVDVVAIIKYKSGESEFEHKKEISNFTVE